MFALGLFWWWVKGKVTKQLGTEASCNFRNKMTCFPDFGYVDVLKYEKGSQTRFLLRTWCRSSRVRQAWNASFGGLKWSAPSEYSHSNFQSSSFPYGSGQTHRLELTKTAVNWVWTFPVACILRLFMNRWLKTEWYWWLKRTHIVYCGSFHKRSPASKKIRLVCFECDGDVILETVKSGNRTSLTMEEERTWRPMVSLEFGGDHGMNWRQYPKIVLINFHFLRQSWPIYRQRLIL